VIKLEYGKIYKYVNLSLHVDFIFKLDKEQQRSSVAEDVSYMDYYSIVILHNEEELYSTLDDNDLASGEIRIEELVTIVV
jgi:hypothetical protein